MEDAIGISYHVKDKIVVKGYKGTGKGTGVFYWINAHTEHGRNDLSIFADSLSILQGFGADIVSEAERLIAEEKESV